jgi:hypothetical protein
LRLAFGIVLREVTIQDFHLRRPYRGAVDVVLFQTWFDLSESQMKELAEQVASTYPGAALVYLDWFAPTDLRYAGALNPYIEFYVKKHVLRDRCAYARPTLGDTNLTDYYSRRICSPLPPTVHNIPDAFWSKLIVGPNFAFTPQILQLLGEDTAREERPIDLHARIAIKGTAWYSAMRSEALAASQSIRDLHIVAHGRISRREFIKELCSSKTCFSPFGYGEVCWRDYEAVMCGALLIKPDMAHLETMPDIFRPFETYVPVRWDLSDLEDTVRYYIAHREERLKITTQAISVVHDYVTSRGFLQQMNPLLRLAYWRASAAQP